MLKVVGASSEQTRLCSWILSLFLVSGVCVMMFSGRIGDLHTAGSPGQYSATVHWTNTGPRIEFWGAAMPAVGAARAIYTHEQPTAGWSQLEIQTSALYADWVQAYLAGFLEGSLTWQLMHWRWTNTIEARCAHAQDECNRVRARLRIASDAMRARAYHLSELYAFWHQVRLFYEQLDGLEAGWWYAVRRNKRNLEISKEDFIWMNIGTELLQENENHVGSFAVVTLQNQTVHVAHSTAKIYGDMLRIVKKYSFNFHETHSPNSNFIAGNNLVFTGYPGSLVSRDNLYMSGGLVVAGGNRRSDAAKPSALALVEESILPVAAIRLARDGRSWAGYFVSKWMDSEPPSQWVVIDTKKLPESTSTTSKFISALRSATQNLNHDKDQTRDEEETQAVLHDKIENLHDYKLEKNEKHKQKFQNNHQEEIKKTHDAEYHREKIEKHRGEKVENNHQTENIQQGENEDYHLSKTENVQKKFISVPSGLLWVVKGLDSADLTGKLFQNGFWTSHGEQAFADLYTSAKEKFTTSENILMLTRQVACQEPCARGDLCSSQSTPYGYIDTKVATAKKTQDGSSSLSLKAISGPIYQETDSSNMDPFNWEGNVFQHVSHVGQPDFWDFPAWTPTWTWN